jgi:hypothetical protein
MAKDVASAARAFWSISKQASKTLGRMLPVYSCPRAVNLGAHKYPAATYCSSSWKPTEMVWGKVDAVDREVPHTVFISEGCDRSGDVATCAHGSSITNLQLSKLAWPA